MVLTWVPETAETSRLRAWSFGHLTAEEAATPETIQAAKDAYYGFNRAVLNEDFEVVRRTHEGMKSPLYSRPGPRHFRELRIYNFHRLLVQMLKEGAGQRADTAPGSEAAR